MEIKGLIFDKDGTLFDFQATWSAWARKVIDQEAGDDDRLRNSLASALGYDLNENVFRADSVVIAETVEVIGQAVNAILPNVDGYELIERLNIAAAAVPQIEVAPLEALFGSLRKAGYTLGIATNDAEEPARAHLESSNIAEKFAFVAGYDSGFGGKPASGQLIAFCERFGFEPSECVMVGDSLHDLEAGKAAGMKTAGVLTGPATAETLSPIADVVLPSIANLQDWLTNGE